MELSSYDKFGSGIFKVLYFVGKFLGILAFDYDFKKELFETSVPATVMSVAICIFVVFISPLVYKSTMDVFYVTEADIDENVSIVNGLQLGFDFLTSFVVLVCQLWKRECASRSANDFRKVFKQLSSEMHCGNIITIGMILLTAMKFSLTMYEVLINIPYVIQYRDQITPDRFVAFVLKQYIVVIALIFSDITFAALLLLARFFYLINELLKSLQGDIKAGGVSKKEIKRLLRVIRLYGRLKRMVAVFSENIELSIFVHLLNSFANMLVNLYVLLDFYAFEKSFEFMSLIYNVMIFYNICLQVYAAERLKRQSADLKDTLLDIDASGGEFGSDWRSDVLTFKVWPEVFEVNVLGMFSLNNMFLLFLITYSTNFIVIILQFQLAKL